MMFRVLPWSACNRTKMHLSPSVSGLVFMMPAVKVVVKQNNASWSHSRNDAPGGRMEMGSQGCIFCCDWNADQNNLGVRGTGLWKGRYRCSMQRLAEMWTRSFPQGWKPCFLHNQKENPQSSCHWREHAHSRSRASTSDNAEFKSKTADCCSFWGVGTLTSG